jgi:predicted transposase/invertase (TIGR01784 family)
MSCDEIPGLKLHDGATRIFLNTHGTDDEGVSEELIQLLRYFEQTTGENAAGSHSRKIEKLQKRVEEIKKNEEVGIRYMNAFEEKMWERREGEMIGKKIGERIGEERGKKSEQREIARRMVEMKMALDIIAKATGLTEQELEALKKRN